MKREVVDIFPQEKAEEVLHEGSFNISLTNKMVLGNIPYYIDQNKEVHIGIPAIEHEQTNKDGSIEKKLVLNFHFEEEEVWEGIKKKAVKDIIEEFENRQAKEEK